MFNHLATLGFPVTTEQDFRHYAYQASEFGQRIESANGSYTHWSVGNGIELWVQTNRHYRIIDMRPHFSGRTRLRVRLTERLPRHRHSILDGAFYAWSEPLPNQALSEHIPFVFDLPDYDLYDGLELPTVTYIQLAAFAYDLQGFTNEEAFRLAQREDMQAAVEALTPTGLFTSQGKARRPARAEAKISGHILTTKLMLNPVTSQRFFWARVHTPIGEIDAVADTQVVRGPIIKEGIVSGLFWLSGRLL